MPITPFHFGPGTLLKAMFLKRFSLLVFILSQIVMDVEPFYYLFTGQYPVHRIFHTYLGCHIVIALTVLFWKLLERVHKIKVSWGALLLSAAIGSYSHVFLDGFMHADMKPFFPFSEANPLLGVASEATIQWLCVIALGAGIALIKLRKQR